MYDKVIRKLGSNACIGLNLLVVCRFTEADYTQLDYSFLLSCHYTRIIHIPWNIQL